MSQAQLLSIPECRSIVSELCGENSSKHVEVMNVEVKPLGGPRAGFMSDHLRVFVTIRDELGNKQELQFFAKSIPQSVPIHREYVESTKFYVKETSFYDGLLKELRAAQGDGGHDRWVPESYLVRDDLIVLEDLSLKGYKVMGYKDLMDLETCEVAFAEIARFHAASIVLEEKNRAAGNERPLNILYPSVLEERSGSTLHSDGKSGWFQASVRSTIKIVEHIPKYNCDSKRLKTIQDKLPEACEVMNTIVKSSSKYRNVVSHGDIWASNVLVKRSNDEKPLKVRFVDFQLVRYAPPATDVLVMWYIMTNKNFRIEHEKKIFAHYYAEFAKELRRYNLSPEKLFPLSEFQETCVYFKELGIIVTALCLQMILLDPAFVDPLFKNPDTFVQFMLTDRSKEIVNAFHSDEEYRQRISEAVEEFIDTYIL